MSLNLNAVLRRCALGRDWLWTRMKRLRRHWVCLVARVVRHARVQRLRFQPSRVHRLHRALGRMSRSLVCDTSWPPAAYGSLKQARRPPAEPCPFKPENRKIGWDWPLSDKNPPCVRTCLGQNP